MRIPSIHFPFRHMKENKIDKALKKTFKQKTVELYTAADTHLVDSIKEWKKGKALTNRHFVPDVKELVSLDVRLPKSKIGQENLDRMILAAAYSMELVSDEFREQSFYAREVLRKLLKDYGQGFFEQEPEEIVEWFESNPFQTITEKDTKSIFFSGFH